jgi:ribosomal protein L37AE/L43A
MPRSKTATKNVGPTANQVLERLRNHEHVPDVILLALGLKQFTSEERGNLRMDVGYDAYTVDALMDLARGRKELRWGAAKLLVCRMLGYEPNIESYCRKENLTPTDLETAYRSLLRTVKVSEDTDTRRPDIHKVREAAWGPRRNRAPPWGDPEWAVIANHIGRRSPKSNAWENHQVFQQAFQGAIYANLVTAQQVNSFGVHGRRLTASILASQATSHDLRARSPELLKLGKELDLTGLEGNSYTAVQMLTTVIQLREPFLNDAAAQQALLEELQAHRARLETSPSWYQPQDTAAEARRTERILEEVAMVQRGDAFHLQCPACDSVTIVQPRLMQEAPRCGTCRESLAETSYVLWALCGFFAANSTGFYHPKDAPTIPEPAPTATAPAPEDHAAAHAEPAASLEGLGDHEVRALASFTTTEQIASTADLYEVYEQHCLDADESARGIGTFSGYLSGLAAAGFLKAEGRTRGRTWTIANPAAYLAARNRING